MKRTPLVLALLAVVALLAAGCGKDDAIPASAGAPTTSTSEGDTTSSSTGDATTTTTGADEDAVSGASDTDAAELRADLAALLDEHTYLAGVTITRLVAEGGSSPAATASAAALDANSASLGDAVSSGYDPEVGEDFLRLWRGHITDYVEYANAKVAGDAGGATAATEALDTFRSDTGDLFESASDEAISADEVAEGLGTHVQATLAVIDAVVAGSPDAVTLLREAAAHAPDAAAVWARGMTAGDDA
jgi:hypothetical protein